MGMTPMVNHSRFDFNLMFLTLGIFTTDGTITKIKIIIIIIINKYIIIILTSALTSFQQTDLLLSESAILLFYTLCK